MHKENLPVFFLLTWARILETQASDTRLLNESSNSVFVNFSNKSGKYPACEIIERMSLQILMRFLDKIQGNVRCIEIEPTYNYRVIHDKV